MAGTTEVEGYPGHPLPSLPELIDLHERLALPARPALRRLRRAEHAVPRRRSRRARPSPDGGETGLPTDDPVRFGPEKLLDAVLTGLEARANRPQGLLSG